MNDALFNNIRAAGSYIYGTGNEENPLYLVHQPYWVDGGYFKPGYFNAPFMQYEPTLLLEDTTFGKILRPSDPSDPVFGFKHIKGTILNDSTDENYSRLILTKADKPSYGSDTVIKNIWPQPQFRSIEFLGDDGFINSGQTNNYLGKIWYLTINLRRLNPESETIIDDSIVLSLKIPYTLGNGYTGFIKFNKFPINHSDSIEQLNYFENRGYSQKLKVSTSIDSISITRKMIPTMKNFQNITITAEFITNDSILIYNPRFTDKPDNNLLHIESIDIIVKYFGKLDIAIDKICIESINSHALLRGEVDSLGYNPNVTWRDARLFKNYHTDPDNYNNIEQLNTIKDIIQTSVDAIKRKTNNWQDAKLFRFYYQDVESNKFYWWGPLRYCNKLSNGMFITRDEQTYPKLYEYYTKCPNRWVGIFYAANDYQMPTPYAKNGNESWESMNLKYGYIGAYGSTHFPDTLNSDYETHIDSTIGFPVSDNYYNNEILNSPIVLQEMWERSLYESYYKPDTKLSEMLYSDKPWWLYHLLYNVQNENEHIVFNYYRPKTGEEIRMLLNSSLIRGCKGFIYDGDENYHFPNCHMGNMGIGDGTRICDTSDVFSNWVGSDYIDSINNTWNAFNYAKLDTLAKRMGISRNKVYIGTRSIRTELFNFHSKIRRADEELMKLRLVASYSKGFRVQQNHHPDYPDDSTFRRFLAWDTTRNRLDTTQFKS